MSYPDDWDQLAASIREQDEYTCRNCARQGGPHGDVQLEVHHVVPLSKGGSNRASNLITLCEDCHNAVHHKNVMAPTADEDPARVPTVDVDIVDTARSAYSLYRTVRNFF